MPKKGILFHLKEERFLSFSIPIHLLLQRHIVGRISSVTNINLTYLVVVFFVLSFIWLDFFISLPWVLDFLFFKECDVSVIYFCAETSTKFFYCKQWNIKNFFERIKGQQEKGHLIIFVVDIYLFAYFKQKWTCLFVKWG